MAGLVGQGPERRKIRRSGTNESGEEACGGRDLWGYAQNMKIFVSHINMHQRASTTEEALNDQVERMILPVDISHPLSLATPMLARWHNRCVNEVVMAAGTEVIYGPNRSLSLRLI